MKNLLRILLVGIAALPAFAERVTIDLKHGSETERETKDELQHLRAS